MPTPAASRLRAYVATPEFAVLIVSYGLFAWFLLASLGEHYFDELHYLTVARLFVEQGPLVEHDLLQQRTYLYPVLLGGVVLLTGASVPAIHLVVAALQYGVLVMTAIHLAAGLRARDLGDPGGARLARCAVLAAITWNPYLVQASTLLLTDSLAASGMAFAIAAAWRMDLGRWGGVLASVGGAAAAMMLRPAAAPGLALVIATIALRLVVRRDARPLAVAARGLVALLPVLPQLWINVSRWGLWSVLPRVPMYAIQQEWALVRLRWVTSVDPRVPGKVVYWSPLATEPGETIFSAILSDPLAFLVAYGAHWFHVLDWGYVDVYVSDVYAPSRLVGSTFGYAFWVLVVIGAVGLWRRRTRGRAGLVESGYWLVLAVAVIANAAFIATTQMETRYAYPVMMLAASFVGPGVAGLAGWLRRGRPGVRAARSALAFATFALATLALSLLFDKTTGRIDWFAHYLG